MVASGHRKTAVLKLIMVYVAEIQNQMLMTCGKLSNQAPSVKSRPMAHATPLPSNCWGYRVD